MLSTRIIFAASMTAMVLVLARGARSGTLKKYPFFYFQLGFAFVAGMLAWGVDSLDRKLYSEWYWISEFTTMILACGNIIEILRNAFTHCREARRFAILTIGILIVSAGIFTVEFVSGPHNWTDPMYFVMIERDFRGGQAFLLTTLLAAVFYLGIQLGRNLTGIFLGYGLYIGTALVTLAIESRFPHSFVRAWYLWQSVAYGVSLLVYLVSLWHYEPSPRVKDVSQVAMRFDSASERVRLLQ